MTNIHENCDNYVKSKDMCLRFFEMGISDVSQYDECAEKTVFSDKDLQRKWSNWLLFWMVISKPFIFTLIMQEYHDLF